MERLALFSTPVVVFDLPHMGTTNAELVDRLLDEERRSAGIRRSNFGGWHSDWDLGRRPDACFQTLAQSIIEHVNRAAIAVVPALADRRDLDTRLLQTWAMIMRNGHYAIPHDHGRTTWSVVYYADSGDSDEPSGELAFSDPRVGARPLPGIQGGELFTFQPRTGALVIFPGWLTHQVLTYCGHRPRISIAANLSMEIGDAELSVKTA